MITIETNWSQFCSNGIFLLYNILSKSKEMYKTYHIYVPYIYVYTHNIIYIYTYMEKYIYSCLSSAIADGSIEETPTKNSRTYIIIAVTKVGVFFLFLQTRASHLTKNKMDMILQAIPLNSCNGFTRIVYFMKRWLAVSVSERFLNFLRIPASNNSSPRYQSVSPLNKV